MDEPMTDLAVDPITECAEKIVENFGLAGTETASVIEEMIRDAIRQRDFQAMDE